MSLFLAKKSTFEDVHIRDTVLAMADRDDVPAGERGKVIGKFAFTQMITVEFENGVRVEYTLSDLKTLAFEGEK